MKHRALVAPMRIHPQDCACGSCVPRSANARALQCIAGCLSGCALILLAFALGGPSPLVLIGQ